VAYTRYSIYAVACKNNSMNEVWMEKKWMIRLNGTHVDSLLTPVGCKADKSNTAMNIEMMKMTTMILSHEPQHPATAEK